MAKRRSVPPTGRLILDAGAVIALARRDARARATVAVAIEEGADVSIPSVVVAEAVRGRALDAPVNTVLRAVGAIDVVDERVGRTAGQLLGTAASSATIDALVVATAVEAGGAMVLTGDVADLRALAARHAEVIIAAL